MSEDFTKDTAQMPLINTILKLGFQYTKFGIVGALSSVVHVSIFIALIELFSIWELYANFFAFLVAVTVSYTGNIMWTFSNALPTNSKVDHRGFIIRFLITALFGLIINSAIVYIFSDILEMEYYFSAMLMLTITPLLVFILNKIWVFRYK